MSTSAIDENGRLFGAVNVVDLLVGLVFLAMLLAGAALVMSSGSGVQSAQASAGSATTVTVQTTVAPYVADAMKSGSATGGDVSAVGNVTVTEEVAVNGSDTKVPKTLYRVRMTATLDTATDDAGRLTFRGERLYVGQKLRLDLGTTIVEGEVVETNR